MERYYTLKETLDILKLADSTVRRYLREGRLKGQKIGRSWRVPESAIKEFLDTNGGLAANKEEAKADETRQSGAGEAKGDGGEG